GRLGVGIVHGHRATLALDEPRAHRVAVIVPRIARLRFLERLIHRLARARAIDARRAAGAARGCAARGCATLRHRAPSARGVAAARAAVGTPACRRSAALRAAGAGFPSGRGASRSASRSAARRYATGRWRDAARAVRAARAARATVARRPAARAGRASARSHWAPTARAAGGSPRERGSAARAHVREKIGALGAAARRRENDAERDEALPGPHRIGLSFEVGVPSAPASRVYRRDWSSPTAAARKRTPRPERVSRIEPLLARTRVWFLSPEKIPEFRPCARSRRRSRPR